jgi:hypothetical protein
VDEAELKRYKRRIEQVRGRLEALVNYTITPGRVDAHLVHALEDVQNALKALRGEPTSAAG